MSAVEVNSTDMKINALMRIVSAIEVATTLDELLLLTLNEFTSMLNISRAAVLMLSEDQKMSHIISTYPPQVTMPPPVPMAETPFLQQAIIHRQTLQIHDVQEIKPASPYIKLLQQHQVRSVLIVPLVAQDRVTGFFAFGTVHTACHFSEEDVALARMLSGQLAAAITSFAVMEAVQRRSAELATLNDIASAVTSSLDTQEIYHLVVEKLNEYFQVEAGSLLMRDDETGDLEFVMTLEAGVEKLAGVKVPKGHGIVGYVAEKQRYAIVHDAENDPRFYSKISEKTGYTTQSILCVPMIVKGRTIGVIELLNKRNGDFTDEDANRLMRMATTIGVAIENARLFQQVANGRERLEAILNSNKDGILMADIHGVVMTVNPRAAQLFQTYQDDLLGRQLSDLLTSLRQSAIEVSVPSWISEHISTSDIVELELNVPQHCFIRQISLPVRDAKGYLIGQLTLLQDISGERELAQLRDDYTGMLVHDLRAPLTAIMNGIIMVRRGIGGPIFPQQDELLGIAYQSSQSMLEMVNTLLDISKMEQGRMTLNLEEFSLDIIVEEMLDRLRASAENHGVVLHHIVHPELPKMFADREKVVRILQNLIDNAVKFSPQQGEVVIGAAYVQIGKNRKIRTCVSLAKIPLNLPDVVEGKWIVFWISDQGPGIPPQYQERIFEKFGQIRGRKVRGTGLGLTFCKLATEAHGGKIWLESVEGEGTTFGVILPLNQNTLSSRS